jgi:hypothetical protein
VDVNRPARYQVGEVDLLVFDTSKWMVASYFIATSLYSDASGSPSVAQIADRRRLGNPHTEPKPPGSEKSAVLSTEPPEPSQGAGTE